jgi:hypothetical protein
MGEAIRKKRDLVPPLSIIGILAVFFVLLELKYPYYFFQDDNRHIFFPFYFHDLRSLIAGEIPFFNFHQYLGVPHLSNGVSAVFMPAIYPALLLSLALLKHPYGSMDALVIAHLLAAALGAYYLMKRMGFGRAAGAFAALTWPLTSFAIYLSASWWLVSLVAACFPFQIYCVISLHEKPRLKTMAMLTALRMYLFLAGHGQYFLYSLIFEGLSFATLYCAGALKDRQWPLKAPACYAGSLVMTLVMSLPLALPLFHQIQTSALRNAPYSWQDFTANASSNALFLGGIVDPFKDHAHPLSYFSHCGYLTVLLLIPLIMGLIKKKIDVTWPLFFLIPGLVAHLSASNLTFMKIVHCVPILNRLRWPFKFEIYTLFALVFLGAIGFHLLQRMLGSASHKRMQLLITMMLMLQCANLWSLYLLTEPRVLRIIHDPVPFTEPLVERLKEGRIVSVGFGSAEPLSVPGLGYDYCLIWGLEGFGGYDFILPRDNGAMTLNLNYDASIDFPDGRLPIPYFRFWGVSSYVVSKEKEDLYKPLFAEWHLEPLYSDALRTVYRDRRMRPMVYWGREPGLQCITFTRHVNYLEAQVNAPEEGLIIFNAVASPFFKASVDGHACRIVPWEVSFPSKLDDRNFSIVARQMGVPVPAGNHRVRVQYSDPYFMRGLLITLALCIVFTAWHVITRRPARVREGKERE